MQAFHPQDILDSERRNGSRYPATIAYLQGLFYGTLLGAGLVLFFLQFLQDSW